MRRCVTRVVAGAMCEQPKISTPTESKGQNIVYSHLPAQDAAKS